MKLLAAQTATTDTNLGLSKATAVAVYASAISIITVIDSDGTEGGTDGTTVGSITVPAASVTVIITQVALLTFDADPLAGHVSCAALGFIIMFVSPLIQLVVLLLLLVLVQEQVLQLKVLLFCLQTF